MNERIKQLAKQSGISILYEYDGYDGHAGVCNLDDIKKFAELIIKECADIALKKGIASPDTDFRTGSYVINQYLLTHFGVEE